MKEKKGLSLVYALKEYARVNGKGSPIIEGKRCFTFDDIKAAFNAGRESVVESLPELEWKGYAPFIHADTPIGRYNIDNFGICLLRFNGKEIPLPPGSSLEETKQAANEHYKKQIKQVLGL
nr:MAG TPA: hypothetical protein [Caudoviricetes sp.]